MAQVPDRIDVRDFTRSAIRVKTARRLECLFLGQTATLPLVCAASLPVLAGVWLLLAPERLLSREMTWDLLFNLSGAWRIHNGQVPHVDFHDPLGRLGFLLTALGFQIVGPSPRAFLVGEMMVLAVAFATAVVAASRRLAPIPAVLFVVYSGLLVLVPANPGDPLNSYTFAMSYNRWGWSALTTLCLVLFVPPRAGAQRVWLDAATSALLLVALFYLKITFAAAAVAALVMAVIVSDHIRAAWRTWGVVLAVVLANAAAPPNYPYLLDIWDAASTGYARVLVSDQIRTFFANGAEFALYGSGVLLLLWLWRRGQAPLQHVVLAGFVLGLGMFVLSQNAQDGNVPVGVIIVYLIYDSLRRNRGERHAFGITDVVLPLAAVLIWPLLSTASAMTTLLGYSLAASRPGAVLTVETTNLRGLAVPRGEDDLALSRSAIEFPYRLLSTTRELPLRHQLMQAEYLQTLLEAASRLSVDRYRDAKILVLDQVSPMSFILGYPPPRGGNLWLWPGSRPPADEVFGDVDVVLIPKFSTLGRATLTALERYQGYLSEQFPMHEESRSWTILARR